MRGSTTLCVRGMGVITCFASSSFMHALAGSLNCRGICLAADMVLGTSVPVPISLVLGLTHP